MKLKKLINSPDEGLNYIERYVNDGSPTGFTWKNTTSEKTRPRSLIDAFSLYKMPVQQKYIEFGLPNQIIKGDYIYLHPDMYKVYSDKNIIVAKEFKVIPTASARTVRLFNGNQYWGYLKLHYNGIIDRVIRTINEDYCSQSIIVSNMLEEIIRNDENEDWGFYREPYAMLAEVNNKDRDKIGMVYRENKPIVQKDIDIIVPFFGLWSKDFLYPNDDVLLVQILNECCGSQVDWVVEKIVEPLIRNYFSLLINYGFQPECHGQNLLIGLTKDLTQTVIIFRDLESLDIDITWRETRGFKDNFPFYPHKCLERHQYNYQMKHSFMYDYKIGEYILSPIEHFLKINYGFPVKKFRDIVKDIANSYILKLPYDFFPHNMWYGYQNVLIDQSQAERPYQINNDLKYRR